MLGVCLHSHLDAQGRVRYGGERQRGCSFMKI